MHFHLFVYKEKMSRMNRSEADEMLDEKRDLQMDDWARSTNVSQRKERREESGSVKKETGSTV